MGNYLPNTNLVSLGALLQMTDWIFLTYLVEKCHYSDATIGSMAPQITGVLIVCLTVCSGTYQRKHQRLAFVMGIYRWPGDFPHKGPVTRKMFPFDDVIMTKLINWTVSTVRKMAWKLNTGNSRWIDKVIWMSYFVPFSFWVKWLTFRYLRKCRAISKHCHRSIIDDSFS